MANKKRILLIVILIAAAAAAVILLTGRKYKSYKVISSTKVLVEADEQYLRFKDNVIKYSTEGVTYINSDNEIVWTAGINMSQPIAEVSGGYALVADKGGNNVAVYDEEGEVSSSTMPYKIIDIGLADSGAFVVVLESETANYINMFSSMGERIYEIKTSIETSGYPLDITVSDDGKRLVTSFIKIQNMITDSSITAYNFGDVGQNENADRMVGGFIFEDELIPKVEFISNDKVAAFGEKEIIIYAMKEKPTETARIKYEREVSSIFYSKDYVGTVESASAPVFGTETDAAKEAATEGDAQSASYILKCYDTNGSLKFKYNFNFAYDNIYADKNEIIITGGNRAVVITSKGKEKFSYEFDSNVTSMIPSSGRNKYIVTFDDRTDIIKLRLGEGRQTDR